jgi:hypothetical protein
MVNRCHRSGLRAEDVAQQLRRAPPPLRLRRPGTGQFVPPAGYIWTNVLAAGLSMRNYGYSCNNLPAGN